jgi:Flp pilus assembly protein TadG
MVRRRSSRSGVAAVELAIVSVAVLAPVLICVWEIGRLIEIKQLVSTSAREGARLAAQGYVISSNGSMLEVKSYTGTPNVKEAVYESLYASGLTTLQRSDVTVTLTFLAPRSDGVMPTDPYLGEKGQPFSVTVTIPWNKVRWLNLGIIQPTTVSYTVTWRMLIDERFTVNETLPTW